MKKPALVSALVLAASLAACSTDQAPPPVQTTHSLRPKITMDVEAVDLADRTGMQPFDSPYNSNRFSPTIAEAIKQWATDRLQAVGRAGQAIIIIKDASLTQQSLPLATGIDSWFTRQQGVKYIGHAEVSVEAHNPSGFATTDASATRSVTLPENPTATERQDAYYSLLNGLMKDLGQNLESGIKTHMAAFIASPPVYGTTAVPTGATIAAPPTPAAVAPPLPPSRGGVSIPLSSP